MALLLSLLKPRIDAELSFIGGAACSLVAVSGHFCASHQGCSDKIRSRGRWARFGSCNSTTFLARHSRNPCRFSRNDPPCPRPEHRLRLLRNCPKQGRHNSPGRLEPTIRQTQQKRLRGILLLVSCS